MILHTLRLSLLLLLLATWPGSVAAMPALSVLKDEIHLHHHLQYLEDPEHALTLEQVREPSQTWLPNGKTAFNRGYSKSTWWLRTQLSNPDPTSKPRLLEIGYAALDAIDIFIVDNGVHLQTLKMGDKLPYAQRPVDHRFFIAPITWQPNQTLDIYLRVRSNGTIQVPLTLWDYSRFYSVDNINTTLEGVYFGGMAAIALYNLLIFFVLRDRNYLIYVGFMICTGMTMAAQSGLAFRFLWPDATQWNDLAIIFFTTATAGFASLFTLQFMQVKTISPVLARWLLAVAVVSGVLMALCFVAPYRIMAMTILIHLMVASIVAVVAGVYALLRGVPSARIYMAAWSILLVGATVAALLRLGVVPVNVFTEYSAQFGSLVECILLSLALANRINAERKLRFAAQNEALRTSQRVNAELEHRVQERTQALEQLNRQLQQLSETDQLTGLANRRHLENRLQMEWARCLRQQHSLAVILLDIDHFKQVNDRFGHPAGDSCLQQVATMIQEGLRWPADVIARYGGEEFCLVLPETDAQGAAKVAERIRERVANSPILTQDKQFKVSVSIGLFAAVPFDECTPAAYVHRADAALYQSKLSGRDRVTIAA